MNLPGSPRPHFVLLWQKMERQSPSVALEIPLDHRPLVDRVAIEDQVQRPLSTVHHFFEKRQEEFPGEGTLIGRKPEGSLKVRG